MLLHILFVGPCQLVEVFLSRKCLVVGGDEMKAPLGQLLCIVLLEYQREFYQVLLVMLWYLSLITMIWNKSDICSGLHTINPFQTIK